MSALPYPDFADVIALTGGSKITFGLGHMLARMTVGYVFDVVPIGLPQSFMWADQLNRLV